MLLFSSLIIFTLFFFHVNARYDDSSEGDYPNIPSPPDDLSFVEALEQISFDKLDNRTIQWDFINSSKAELLSSNCNNPSFPTRNKKDISLIRLIFNTSVLIERLSSQSNPNDRFVAFSVHCPNDVSNSQDFSLGNHHLDPVISYTTMIVYVGKCRRNLYHRSRTLIGITFKFFGLQYNTFPEDTFTMKEKILFPSPTKHFKCSLINNFKTVYFPDIPYNTTI